MEKADAFGVVNLRTGEVKALLTPPPTALGGKWVRLFQDRKRELMERSRGRVHGQSYEVLAYLETVSAWDNGLPSAADTATVLGMHRTAVARAYGELVEAQFIVKKGTRYFLSPWVAWKGSAKAFDAACQELFSPPAVAIAAPR